MQTNLGHISRSNVKFVFTNLPFEIIAEILKVLDWVSLLKIRQVCKHLDAISRTHMVWEGQYHQYVAKRICLTRLEAPLESYSVEELEQWVLVRRSADIGWKREDVKPVRSRTIDHSGVGSVCIVPGGRWLLVGDTNGSVTVYDLDAPMQAGEPLIPLDMQTGLVHNITVVVDSVREYPNLAFTMALSTGFYFTSHPPKLSVWRVVLVGQKAEARLIANRLCFFQSYNNCFVRDVTIYNHLFARMLSRRDFSCIEVVDWERSRSSVHCKATIFPEGKIENIRLLPGNRLLAFSNTHITMYRFAAVDGAEAIDPTPGFTRPVWSLSIPFAKIRTLRAGLYGDVSQGLYKPLVTHFILASGNLIQNLIVPNNEAEGARLVEMVGIDARIPLVCAVVLERAFLHYQDGSVSRLTFLWDDREIGGVDPWPPGSCVRATSKGYPATRNLNELPKFDEETGRVIQASRDSILIIDTALIYLPCAESI